jgi:hypothetical protein
MLTALLAAALYIAHPPAAPDLAAQVARVDAARSGAFLWWNGWFGGLQLPAYSALSPIVMSKLGVSVAAALAALVSTWIGLSIFRHSRRPIAGAAMLGVAAFADIFAGRVTFALGAAAAVGSVALIRRQSTIAAVAVACLAFLLAPLAGLFLGMAALAVAVADPDRRRSGIAVAAALVVAGVIQIVIFPGAGQMPYPWWHMAVALLITGVVALVCPDRTVRAGCAIVAAATVFFFLVPSPVGTNVVRLAWLAAAPIVAANGQFNGLPAVSVGQFRRLPVIALVLGLAVWPAIDLGIQLHTAASPAAQQTFFTPLVAAWRAQAAQQPMQASGERVELINPTSQWGAAYVAPIVPIARGWDRPTDRADNALFYDGSLTASSYHAWLENMSVGWVALPLNTPLDYASRSEAAVVQQHPAYLQPVWHNSSWQLFRVTDAEPLVRGASIVSVNSTGLTFQARASVPIDVKERWSPYLRLSAGNQLVSACIVDQQPWTQITVPRSGTYTLSAKLDLNSDSHTGTCAST